MGVHWQKSHGEQPLSQALPFGTHALETEWALLVACAAPGYSPEGVAARLAAKLNWNVLLDLASEHGVLGLLAQRLQELSYQSVPPDAREKVQERMRAQHLFTLSLTAELFQLLDDFSTAGVAALLIKGPAISMLAYGDSSMRGYGDLDLLVRHSEILHASQRMVALGFQADVPESAIRAGKIPGEYVFKRPDTQRIIELHTEHTFRYYPRPMPIESLYARQNRLLVDGRPVPALSLEDELLLDCIHGAKDFWERLMWIADVAALTRHPELDWDKAWQAAREVRAERMLLVGLQLGAMLLDSKLPAIMATLVSQHSTVPALCRQVLRWLPMAGNAPPALHERAMFRLRMGGGGLAGVKYLCRLSLSPTEEDWVEGAEERRFWLWDAVRRPFRLIRKYGQNS